jgi:hypothetical protein
MQAISTDSASSSNASSKVSTESTPRCSTANRHNFTSTPHQIIDKEENHGFTCRKNILVLATTGDWQKGELDRFMIALFRYQTEGRVAYRRLIGMHGGGGGWKGDPLKPKYYEDLLLDKANADYPGHYKPYETPKPFFWPDTSPNFAVPEKQTFLESPYTYTFCWHAKPHFLIWYRPLMLEIELGLQDYDIEQHEGFDPNDLNRFEKKLRGSKALGLHYWAWETWDGIVLPLLFTSPTYVIRSNKYELKGYPSGRIIPNPLYRWYAPVSLKDQMEEKFPGNLDDYNCTTRNPCFTDLSITPENNTIWPLQSVYQEQVEKKSIIPPMLESVEIALNRKEFLLFGTTIYGAQYSIEECRNLLHNHVAGYTLGGSRGPGRQVNNDDVDNSPYMGTMAPLQSIFDPIFLIHHSNVERQLCSWQYLHPGSWDFKDIYTPELEIYPMTAPPQEVMKTVLYPWTKPEVVYDGKYSWNTEVGDGRDGKLSDWWFAFPNLEYKYDELLEPYHVINMDIDKNIPNYPIPQGGLVGTTLIKSPKYALITFDLPKKGGQYILLRKSINSNIVVEDGIKWDRITIRNVLTSTSTGCLNILEHMKLIFEVSHINNDDHDDGLQEFNPEDFKLEWMGGRSWTHGNGITIEFIDHIGYKK